MLNYMDRFFKKHSDCLGDKEALKLVHSKIHSARKAWLEDKDYLKCLAEARGMINDIFYIKGVDPDKIVTKEPFLNR